MEPEVAFKEITLGSADWAKEALAVRVWPLAPKVTLLELEKIGPYIVMAEPLLLTVTFEAPTKDMEPEVAFKEITLGSADWVGP
jgi:hypothetical protein